MTYEVHTSVFEGPLDLLLQLITQRTVDITEVSLTDLVTEFVSYVDEMRTLELDGLSEFLLVAATLIQLKARHLLPNSPEVDMDEELLLMEERDRLLSRLLACVTFQDVAAVLGMRIVEHKDYVGRTVGIEDQPQIALPNLVLPIDADGLAAIAVRALAPKPTEPELDHLDFDVPSVSEAIDDLRARITEDFESDFAALVAHCERPAEVIAYFLAILELGRWGLVQVRQEDRSAPIRVQAAAGRTESQLLSEWDQ